MITLHYKKLKLSGLILLALPAVVFFVTWLKLYIGIPCAILLCAAVYFASKGEDKTITVKKSTIIVLLLLLTVWAVLSGIGGFFTQKSDHNIRNVILRDLINYSWPVKYNNAGDESLVYYIGYWLVPALFGKLGAAVGGFNLAWVIARIAMVVWTVILLFNSFVLILFKTGAQRKKAVYFSLLIFVLFSGMDALGSLFDPSAFFNHLEWWASAFQYSSMSTQLCWVFNQSVPAWLACSIAFNEKDEKSFALIGLLLLPTSPLPLVGLAAYMIMFAVRSLILAVKDKNVGQFFKNIFTPQNILAIVTLFPVYALYYGNNAVSTDEAAGGTAALALNFSPYYIGMYIFFCLVEFGFMLLALHNKSNRFESLVILLSLMAIPFVTVGNGIDFCMRASIPALYLLMIMLMDYLVPELLKKKDPKVDKNSKEYQKRARKLLTVLLIFTIGVFTPLVEYSSSMSKFIQTKGECVTEYDYLNSLTDLTIDHKMNFVGTDSSNSAFYRYIGK
ncbi:MAG: hypothetical protein IJS03_08465 [Eubacterium sp.]|nr:hypothetical protein [Eubacterium sp.]